MQLTICGGLNQILFMRQGQFNNRNMIAGCDKRGWPDLHGNIPYDGSDGMTFTTGQRFRKSLNFSGSPVPNAK
jgi:hypothetical protein